MTTTIPTPAQIERRWVLIDAENQVLGRLASRVARILRGKHKAMFTRHLDTGDFVVIINAAKIRVTGKKREQKLYQRYSGYPGGRRVETFGDLMKRQPERAIRLAVKGMMPDGPLARRMIGKLKVYADKDHPHHAQKPQPVTAAMLR